MDGLLAFMVVCGPPDLAVTSVTFLVYSAVVLLFDCLLHLFPPMHGLPYEVSWTSVLRVNCMFVVKVYFFRILLF